MNGVSDVSEHRGRTVDTRTAVESDFPSVPVSSDDAFTDPTGLLRVRAEA